MDSRERTREGRRRAPDAAPEPLGRSTAGLRQAGADLLAAADEAINRALSGDSEAFLSANRQEGGQ